MDRAFQTRYLFTKYHTKYQTGNNSALIKVEDAERFAITTIRAALRLTTILDMTIREPGIRMLTTGTGQDRNLSENPRDHYYPGNSDIGHQ